jgi:hypothetical protein
MGESKRGKSRRKGDKRSFCEGGDKRNDYEVVEEKRKTSLVLMVGWQIVLL